MSSETGSKQNVPRDWRDDGELADPDTKTEFERRRGWHRKLYDAGWMCIHWPKEYGGRGATLLQQLIYQQEIDRAKAPPVVNFQGIARVGPTLMQWGTAEQKEAIHPADSIRRGDLVPGIIRAQSWLRSRRGRDPRSR